MTGRRGVLLNAVIHHDLEKPNWVGQFSRRQLSVTEHAGFRPSRALESAAAEALLDVSQHHKSPHSTPKAEAG